MGVVQLFTGVHTGHMDATTAPTARSYFRGAYAVVRDGRCFSDGSTYRIAGLFTAAEAYAEVDALGAGWHAENLGVD